MDKDKQGEEVSLNAIALNLIKGSRGERIKGIDGFGILEVDRLDYHYVGGYVRKIGAGLSMKGSLLYDDGSYMIMLDEKGIGEMIKALQTIKQEVASQPEENKELMKKQ